MRRNLSPCLIAAVAASTMIAVPARGDTPYDPDAYYCREEPTSPEFGTLQAYIYANKRSDYRSFEGEWRSNTKAPRIRAHWGGSLFSRDRNVERGIIQFSYNNVVSANKVRIHIGSCPMNQKSCKSARDYASDFKQGGGYLSVSNNWGAVVSIGRAKRNLYIQIQDEAGAVLREDRLPMAMLLNVEKEMSRLMDAASEKQARLKDQCMARKPLNTPPH
ncbi:hypothetical protein [Sphingopyxis sp. DBS4]|uniref:hypothetical protein n=1 Tax=Sphingopyxis sp. DBS4 TaxID=2968500 RepID=UPI00214ACF08|nr:hypothetical protein [Sphingopyxis sp. DBS4]